MHGSAGRQHSAFAALALALALLASPACGEQASAAVQHGAGQSDAEAPIDPASPPTRLGAREQACAEADEAGHDDPQYYAKRDLCAQYRAAIAAEKNAASANVQIALSLIGLVAILVTLWFTAWSARAAAESAKAAAKSNAQAREFFTQERRPWIAVDLFIDEDSALNEMNERGQILIGMNARNTGLSPAMNVRLHMSSNCAVIDFGPEQRAALNRQIQTRMERATWAGMAVFPGDTEQLARNLVIQMQEFIPPAGQETAVIFVTLPGFVFYEAAAEGGNRTKHTTPAIFDVFVTRRGGEFVRIEVRMHDSAPEPT